ncbi:FUSC family protein [Trinickia acidisoli]|uniref:FUSC family protein n=1 Tax=Trinickia acidisoli TaxID=2767482 RepID=UPI002852EA8A|nr:FUSC family protein [Trinickia acidisoli]
MSHRFRPFRWLTTLLPRAVVSPYCRFRHAGVLHGVRVGLAMLVSILVTTGIHVPNGIWASVTVLVVIGGLQHHGNIRKKAADRALGTTLGAFVGLVLIAQLHVIGSMPLTYVLMAIAAGVCGYYAIGEAGYIALLTAITICIVAGHGGSTIETGLWRTLNVLIGIAIALAFSFALPLYATYSWRYLLARNLRDCARIRERIACGRPLDVEAHVAAFAALNGRLVKLRSLMPSVAKEVDIPLKRLEAIQRLHRSTLSALEMMSTSAAMHPAAAGETDDHARAERACLLTMARALRFGSESRAGQRLAATPSGAEGAHVGPARGAPDETLPGPRWIAQWFAEQVDALRGLLAETEPHWHIEGDIAASAQMRRPR